MPPPDMPPSMRNPQKSRPSLSALRPMIVSVNSLVIQGMMALSGPFQFSVVRAAKAFTSPRLSAASMPSKMTPIALRASHSTCARSRYFSVTISRMGPTFCAMPPCTSTSD